MFLARGTWLKQNQGMQGLPWCSAVLDLITLLNNGMYMYLKVLAGWTYTTDMSCTYLTRTLLYK